MFYTLFLPTADITNVVSEQQHTSDNQCITSIYAVEQTRIVVYDGIQGISFPF